MAYFNNTNNAGFYPSSSFSGGLDAYPYLSQGSATEEFNHQISGTFTDHWNMVGSPISLQATASCGKYHCDLFVNLCLKRGSSESVASVTSYGASANDYSQMSHRGNHWPTVNEWPQYHHSGFSSHSGSFVGTVASERSVAQIPVPSSSKDPSLLKS